MNFYYNAELNMCADRRWVVNYLFYGGMVESREEAREGLDTCREFYGWYDCEVCDSMKEAMGVDCGVYYVNPNKDGPH